MSYPCVKLILFATLARTSLLVERSVSRIYIYERVSVGSVIKFKTQFAKLDCITWNNLDKFVTWKRSIGKKSFSPIGNVELTKVGKKEKKRKEKHPRSCRKGEIKERNERKEEKLISRIIRFKV